MAGTSKEFYKFCVIFENGVKDIIRKVVCIDPTSSVKDVLQTEFDLENEKDY